MQRQPLEWHFFDDEDTDDQAWNRLQSSTAVHHPNRKSTGQGLHGFLLALICTTLLVWSRPWQRTAHDGLTEQPMTFTGTPTVMPTMMPTVMSTVMSTVASPAVSGDNKASMNGQSDQRSCGQPITDRAALAAYQLTCTVRPLPTRDKKEDKR